MGKCDRIEAFIEAFDGEIRQHKPDYDKMVKNSPEAKDYEKSAKLNTKLQKIKGQCNERKLTKNECNELKQGMDIWNDELKKWVPLKFGHLIVKVDKRNHNALKKVCDED
jgi:hypothetical protein